MKRFEYYNRYTPIDIIFFIRDEFPNCYLYAHERECNHLIIYGTDISIYIYDLEGDGTCSFNWIQWSNQYSKYETFEERYKNTAGIKIKIMKLEEQGKTKEIQNLKNTKWLTYKEQEKLFNSIKRKFQFKHKIEEPKELIKRNIEEKLWEERGDILDGLTNLNILSFYNENDINSKKKYNYNGQHSEVLEKFDEMVKKELENIQVNPFKKNIKDRLSLLNKVQEKLNEYNYENYFYVKGLDGNLINTKEYFKKLKKEGARFPHMFYDANDVIKKIEELKNKK